MTDITESVLHDPAVIAAIEAAEAKLKAQEVPVAPVPPSIIAQVLTSASAPATPVPPVPAAAPAPRVQHPTTTPPVGYNSRIIA